MPAPLQLGTLVLASTSDAGPSSGDWALLDTAYLESTAWAEGTEKLVEQLIALLRDTTTGFAGERRCINDAVHLRLSIVPNDDTQWLRNGRRPKRLRSMFELLDKGWDELQGRLLESPPVDQRTGMQALYALIESPPEPAFGTGEYYGDDDVFASLKGYENPLGVRTMMYRYQLRSVARMLQMETTPGTMVDPSYARFAAAGTGERYFVNLQSMDVRRFPDRFALSRGGILCEQMGVGKTLMCLALVLLSRHQGTRPPEAPDVSGIITDVALRTFSTAPAATMRRMIRGGNWVDGVPEEAREGEEEADPNLIGTPSLASLCAEVVLREHPGARFGDWPESVNNVLDRQMLYFRFPAPPRLPRRSKKVLRSPAERYILAPTTLVVVPPILVPQWQAEAETHLDEGALKILVVPEQRFTLPPIEELIRHDLVLMSLDRFRHEGQRSTDSGELTTELLRVRWKRIILDEGNIANNTKSDAMILADALSIERRWIVSGTPTTRLKQGTEQDTKSIIAAQSLVDAKTATGPSKWSRADLDDVRRLGSMLRGFLAAEVFKTEDFARLVTKPLRKLDGPAYGAVERIRQIMSAIMVKHRPGVIDDEVALPPSTLSAEVVHFTHWQKLTYNALTALVASNVYTANFEDIDYFLHPRNTEAFNQVVANLHLACLWFSSYEMDLEGAVARTETHLGKSTKLSDAQRAGLEEAIGHMRAALDEPGWAEWMRNGSASVPFTAPTLPALIQDNWSDAPDSLPSLLDAHSLRLLRDLNRRGAVLNDIAHVGWDERAKRPQAEAFLKMMTRAEKFWLDGLKRDAANAEDAVTAPAVGMKADTRAAAHKPSAPRAVRQQKAKKKDKLDKQLDDAAQNAQKTAELTTARPRALPSVIRTASGSSKVNYVVRSVLGAEEMDKFIIFGSWEEIAHVTEALDLAGIESVYAGARVGGEKRKASLKQFQQKNIRVCLLELKFAARGLTLTLANRMIFLSPVWSLDVQAQAIKRIHRIGQTRPTHIEILVTEGTFEEDIVRRESSARSNDEEKRYSRALIENPRFVTAELLDAALYPISLVPRGTASVDEEKEYAHLAAGVTPPSTRTGTAVGTPVVTPTTPELQERIQEDDKDELDVKKLEVKMELDEKPKGKVNGKKKRTIRFADDVEEADAKPVKKARF